MVIGTTAQDENTMEKSHETSNTITNLNFVTDGNQDQKQGKINYF